MSRPIPEWEPTDMARVVDERWLHGAELAAEADAYEQAHGTRPERVRVRDVVCTDGSLGREWGYR